MTLALNGGGWSASRPGCLYPRERPSTHYTEGWVGPRAGLDRCRKSRPHWDLIPGPSSPQRVAISTELSRPLINSGQPHQKVRQLKGQCSHTKAFINTPGPLSLSLRRDMQFDLSLSLSLSHTHTHTEVRDVIQAHVMPNSLKNLNIILHTVWRLKNLHTVLSFTFLWRVTMLQTPVPNTVTNYRIGL
jgi:hypothetical protein